MIDTIIGAHHCSEKTSDFILRCPRIKDECMHYIVQLFTTVADVSVINYFLSKFKHIAHGGSPLHCIAVLCDKNLFLKLNIFQEECLFENINMK